jgi:hypothetical protein
MSLRLRVTYAAADELVRDHDQQMLRGGLLVKVPPPAGLERSTAVELELVVATGRVSVSGQVVQAFPGMGVAVGFAPPPELAALVALARGMPPGGPAATHELVDAAPAPEPEPDTEEPGGPVRQTPAGAAAAAKIKLALHGNRDERAAVLRDHNRALHVYVLRNPGLGIDEVLTIARMTAVSAELHKQIAERREWLSRPEIASALCRNHAVPVPIALRALEHVTPTELKALAKDIRVREPISRAARKKVIRP